jgi:hypothetical protein
MAIKKEYVWTSDSRLIMKCSVDYKDNGGFLYLKTANGSLLIEPRKLGVDCFASKKVAIEHMVESLRNAIGQQVSHVYRLQKSLVYLEKLLTGEGLGYAIHSSNTGN